MRRRAAILIPVLALVSALLFVGFTPGLPWQSVDERWGSAVMSQRFDAAGSLMSTDGSHEWVEQAERFRNEHGELRGYGSTVVALPPVGDKPVYRKRLVWEDGFVSCALTRETPDGSLGLLSEYEGCSELVTTSPPGLPASYTFVEARLPPEPAGIDLHPPPERD